MPDAIIFDVDGTLVDSNYQHALAWYRALRRYRITVPLWQIHRAIGMGGDQLVTHVAGEQAEAEHGDALRKAWAEEFEPMLPEISAFADAVPLLTAVRDRGLTLVLASSGAPQHVQAYLELVDGQRLADDWTTSEDVASTKPAPDLVQAAMKKAGRHLGCHDRRLHLGRPGRWQARCADLRGAHRRFLRHRTARRRSDRGLRFAVRPAGRPGPDHRGDGSAATS